MRWLIQQIQLKNLIFSLFSSVDPMGRGGVGWGFGWDGEHDFYYIGLDSGLLWDLSWIPVVIEPFRLDSDEWWWARNECGYRIHCGKIIWILPNPVLQPWSKSDIFSISNQSIICVTIAYILSQPTFSPIFWVFWSLELSGSFFNFFIYHFHPSLPRF